MEDLQDFLKGKKYKKIPFKVLKTQHLLIKGTINGVKGNFILDTGASNSCVGFESVDRFLLNAQFSETKAAGAGAVGMETQLAKNNEIQLGRWKKKFHLIVFDMRHVNEALIQYKTKPVDGIIGADVLLKGKAIIDYSNHYLYLK
jgi:predicted aspartyl protease